tara:strand:+ start:264 stop:779 length:516 start_codon:yes stop_codon:yes gene_type:complete
MTSKLKTDVLETVSGSGTIALTNQLSGMTTASLPSGSVIQVASTGYPSSSAISLSTSNNAAIRADLMTITMTVRANSKVMMWFESGQIDGSSTGSNANIYFKVDGTDVDNGTNHYFFGASLRPSINKIKLTNALSAGSHTFTVSGSAYGGAIVYNFQSVNTGSFMIQEIAG